MRSAQKASESLSAEANGRSTAAEKRLCTHDARENWFSAESMASALPLSDIVDKHEVTLFSSEERADKARFPSDIA